MLTRVTSHEYTPNGELARRPKLSDGKHKVAVTVSYDDKRAGIQTGL